MAQQLTAEQATLVQTRFWIPIPEGQFESVFHDLCRELNVSKPTVFLYELIQKKILHKFQLKGQRGDRKHYFSSRPEVPPYEAVCALWPGAYFCNLTAIFYHNLTNQIPSSIYMAREGKGRQRDKPQEYKNTLLTDESIFQAFIKPPRVTSNQYKLPKGTIILTERTDRGEVGIVTLSDAHKLLPAGARVTSLERTLIDACVNPQYNGGIMSVMDYYREAVGRIDVEKLIDIYRCLAYLYPYWQAIGFICERAGATKVADKLHRSFKVANEFYLDHNAKTNWAFDEKWKLHYPRIV